MNTGWTFRHLGTCLAILGGSSMAMAAEVPVVPQTIETESGWEITVAPFYLWVTGLKGDIAAGGSAPVAVDVSPIDLIENIDSLVSSLDFAIIGAASVRKGDFGFFTDIYYLKLTTKEATPGPVFSSAKVGTKLFIFTGLGTYRLFESDTANVDALAGARLWTIDTKLDLGAGIAPAESFSDGDTWVDPVIGLKGSAFLSENTYVTGWAMVGGFGVSSEFMWDVFGGLGYEVTDSMSLIAGYRATGVDYHSGGFSYDIVQYGPLLGAVFRF